MAIKDTLIEFREHSGLSHAETAQRPFVTRRAASPCECGDTQPGIDALELVATTFHAPAEALPPTLDRRKN